MLAGPRDLRVEEVAVPTPPAGHALVSVEAAGVCGSDLHGYGGVNARRRLGSVMGHEVSGTVHQVGPGADPRWVGRGVVVNPVLGCDACDACRAGQAQRCPDKLLIGCTLQHPGGFADYLLAPVRALAVWPGPAPLAWGAFAEPLAVGLHAVSHVAVKRQNVLIVGSGAIGVAAALSARRAGGIVTVTQGDEHRIELLRDLGLSCADADTVRRAAPFGVVVDCVASDESLDLALQHLAIGGTVVLVGLAASLAAVSVERLVQGDRMLRGSAQYSRASFLEAVRWLSDGQVDISQLIDRKPLAEAPALFRRWEDDAPRPLRTLLTPH